ncbi:hypothetical protein L326_06610 [Yersinia pestis 113]|nr:hypothetical protein L327_06645 [Yersinia pestis S3]ERP76241.1 hypothetical protein L328_06635 [Yersinia pestis 24H]ERP76967.1 hypothetical protein L326_06610 [Yersinia pestis 113]ERP83471.1 hypothetical protein L325_06600 [Yersinia pestis 9]QOW13364.1 hypothetical protein S96127_1058 [Yersinia pestis]
MLLVIDFIVSGLFFLPKKPLSDGIYIAIL